MHPKAIAEELGTDVDHRTSQYKNNVLEQDHRGIKGRYRSMRGFKAFASADRFCRTFDELPAPGYLHQPERFARLSAGHPRSARGRATGPDLRRLIQLMVGISLALVPLAPKADRTIQLVGVNQKALGVSECPKIRMSDQPADDPWVLPRGSSFHYSPRTNPSASIIRPPFEKPGRRRGHSRPRPADTTGRFP